MTREEAIEIINRENDPNDKTVWEVFPEYREALDMAISALEQQPCEDAVSRDAVMRLIENKPYDWSNLTERHNMLMEIRKLPSVTQKSDNKYRKEAKRWKNKWLKSQKSGHWIEENHDEYELWICSECGAYTELDMSEEYGCGWKFCPKCGAKMESEDKE